MNVHLNPDNLIFFYLTGAIIALAFAIFYLASELNARREKNSRKHEKAQ